MGITGGVLGLVDFIPSTTKMLIVIKHSPGYCLALSSLSAKHCGNIFLIISPLRRSIT